MFSTIPASNLAKLFNLKLDLKFRGKISIFSLRTKEFCLKDIIGFTVAMKMYLSIELQNPQL